MPLKGFKHSELSKIKMAESQRGKKHSDETRKKISQSNTGKIFSEEHRRKLSENAKNRPEEWRKKIGDAHKGKKISEENKQKLREWSTGRIVSEETRKKLSIANKGKKISDEARKKMSLAKKGKIPPHKSPFWKGGVRKAGIPLYNTFSHQLVPMEETRRNPDNIEYLQVKCTYCGKWFQPTISIVKLRIGIIKGQITRGEGRFYCLGDGCRLNCSIYHQAKFPRGFKPVSSREVSPDLRKIVFERDDYTCQKCESKENLHCHHVLGAVQNPMFANDPDNCITLCEQCHLGVHKENGCRTIDLRCSGIED